MNGGKEFFRSRRDMYGKNYDMGQKLRVIPAAISHDTGATPGVAIYSGTFLMAAITAEHAWALADKLADVLDALQQDAV
ncbi:hypothetical protein ACIP9X_05630 [Arthrobacter sp. NPDC093125]|uniref:hypothetical protein n=1 Tax=Arthrobacter sp. NPDC093125 TaxID=3363944 RepID=UPI003805902D